MKRVHVYLSLSFVLLISLACASASAPPASTPAPAAKGPVVTVVVEATHVVSKAVITTPTPGSLGLATTGEEGWARIRTAGKLRVGTSSGSAPFAQQGVDFRLNGFDIALAREIGGRLGLQVQIVDLAAEGLPGALQFGQVDMGLATLAASLAEMVPGQSTRPYFISNGSVLVRSDGGIDAVRGPSDLAGRRVGVQQGTHFEAWARDNLVATGQAVVITPVADLLVYRDIEQAVDGLVDGLSDALVLDSAQARRFASRGGLKVTGAGLMRAAAVAAVAADSIPLRNEIDRTLAQMSQDGALAQLAGQYLGLGSAELLPVPTPGPVGGALPTAAPPGCLDGMAWVADLTYADNAMQSPPVLLPGQAFVKTFRLRNVGTCAWGPGYALTFALGSSPLAQMEGRPVQLRSAVSAGAESDISLALVAPTAPGVYMGAWEMQNRGGVAFGERISVGILVREPPTAAPSPVPTVPVGSFTADHTYITPGECVVVAWNIRNLKEVYFYAEDQPWEQHGATGEEARRLCPASTTTYELRLVQLDSSVEVRRITITVGTGAEIPVQVKLVTAPGSQVRSGECVDVSWEVQGTADRVQVLRDETLLWENAPQAGNLRDCPSGIGDVVYAVVVIDPRETVQTQRVLRITQ